MRKPSLHALDALLRVAGTGLDPYSATRGEVTRWLRAGTRAVHDFLSASHAAEPDTPPVAFTPDELQSLFVDLDLLLRAGFETEDEYGRTLPLESLRFGVRPAGRPERVKRSAMSRKERRAYESPGAYVLQVSGTTHDVVLYLVLTLLTAEGMTGAIARCAAPARGNYQARCEGWVVNAGRGRRREFCGTACRVRHYEAQRAAETKAHTMRNRRGIR